LRDIVNISYFKQLVFIVGLIQSTSIKTQENNDPIFIKNNGQFNSKIEYKLTVNAGEVFFENNKITYNLFQKDILNEIKHNAKNTKKALRGHAYEVVFNLSNQDNKPYGTNKNSAYNNYFIGNDTTKWKANVPSFKELNYDNIYDGIDLKYYEKNGKLKYDFIVGTNANPDLIKMSYNGLDSIYKLRGNLILKNSLGSVIEQKPYAYQLKKGKKIDIPCSFKIINNEVRFVFPKGYNKNLELVIDPVLIFSTYSGSTANNWGQTATYDNSGNLYAGSIAFSLGYPTTLGPFQAFYQGNPSNMWESDICISKFNSTGTGLIYSTYLGGTGNENPHSLVVNDNDELFVFGSTGSNDFPTTLGCYDNTFNGGSSWAFLGIIDYNNGIDAFVTKFSSSGNSLIGSTYVGGSGNDGVNLSGLVANYADDYRGEIIVDSLDNCWIASSTSSTDFPMVNPVQNSNGGSQDAIVFKLNNNLTNLEWSTYFGGSGDEAGYSIQLDSQNQPVITGGTENSSLPTTTNVIHPNSQGGQDGFLTKYNVSTNTIQNCTYIGTSSYDQSYFVQLDDQDNIYLFGQTGGNYPVTGSSVYSNPLGTQFIHKLSPSMDATIFSTVFGSGNLQVNISPSAFLVSNCGLIYISGWGGTVNQSGNTNNMPITANAFQNTTDGSDFYLAVFDNNAQSLLYSTYFGGGQSSEHVDGGTSRFDKNGKIYQAVCAGCFNNSDFPTSPGAYASQNLSSCNLGVFKFAFENIVPSISVPQSFVCLPNSFQFTNQSQGGNVYNWDFGDGTTSSQFSPSHIYADTGTFDVTLIVSDSISCINSDTAIIQVNVYALNNASIVGNDTICLGDSTLLTGYGGTDYLWTPSSYLSNNSSQQVYASPPSSTNYTLTATDSCGVDSTSVLIVVILDNYQISPDTSLCIGDSVQVNISGGIDYFWYSLGGLIYPDSSSPCLFPTSDQYYYVEIITDYNCVFKDSILVEVDNSIPQINLVNDTSVCIGDSIFFSLNNLNNATWTPIQNLSNSNDINTWASPNNDITYYVSSTNQCGTSLDSVFINVFGVSGNSYGDTVICKGDTVQLTAEMGESYLWIPQNSLSDPDSAITNAFPNSTTVYEVTITNNLGCDVTLQVEVIVRPSPYVDAGPTQWSTFGNMTTLQGSTNSTIYYWDNNEWLSCYDCLNPQAAPSESAYYVLNVVDSFGCYNTDTTFINMEGFIYVPNTFTPNNDGINDVFEIKGEYINNFNLWIYNRWGEQVYYTDVQNDFWDGTRMNENCKIDVYVWKIEYIDARNNLGKLKGHVNLLR
jgi:gliding motility-associated-like protein